MVAVVDRPNRQRWASQRGVRAPGDREAAGWPQAGARQATSRTTHVIGKVLGGLVVISWVVRDDGCGCGGEM